MRQKSHARRALASSVKVTRSRCDDYSITLSREDRPVDRPARYSRFKPSLIKKKKKMSDRNCASSIADAHRIRLSRLAVPLRVALSARKRPGLLPARWFVARLSLPTPPADLWRARIDARAIRPSHCCNGANTIGGYPACPIGETVNARKNWYTT